MVMDEKPMVMDEKPMVMDEKKFLFLYKNIKLKIKK